MTHERDTGGEGHQQQRVRRHPAQQVPPDRQGERPGSGANEQTGCLPPEAVEVDLRGAEAEHGGKHHRAERRRPGSARAQRSERDQREQDHGQRPVGDLGQAPRDIGPGQWDDMGRPIRPGQVIDEAPGRDEGADDAAERRGQRNPTRQRLMRDQREQGQYDGRAQQPEQQPVPVEQQHDGRRDEVDRGQDGDRRTPPGGRSQTQSDPSQQDTAEHGPDQAMPKQRGGGGELPAPGQQVIEVGQRLRGDSPEHRYEQEQQGFGGAQALHRTGQQQARQRVDQTARHELPVRSRPRVDPKHGGRPAGHLSVDLLGQLEDRRGVVGGPGPPVGDAGRLQTSRDLERIGGVEAERVVLPRQHVDGAAAATVVVRRDAERGTALGGRRVGAGHEAVEDARRTHAVASRTSVS